MAEDAHLTGSGSGRTKQVRHRFSSRVVAPIAIAVDVACLVLAAPVALFLHMVLIGGRHNSELHVAAAVIAGLSFLLLRISHDSYSRPLGRLQDTDQGVIFDYFIAAALSITIIWQLGLADDFSRGLVLIYAALAVAFLFLSRFALRSLIKRLSEAGHIAQRVVLFGAEPETAERAFNLLQLERLPHLKIVGFADDRKTRVSRESVASIPYLGGFSEVVRLAQIGDLDQVLIALQDITQERLDSIVEELSSVSVDVSLLPREVLALTANYRVSFIGSAPVFSIWERPVRDMDVVLKAIEDRVLAAAGLIFLAPLLLGVAILIKLTSDGPVLFRQRRFGFNNVEISVLKFRSMYIDKQDVSGAARTTKGDRRITPVGRVIRRLSIDELPQLWNVLRGEMSIVGPRPHATSMRVGDRYYFDAVRGYAARHRVKPGLTGLAQVRGLRGEIDSIEKARRRVEYDRFYIENWSLMLDFRIILETMFRIVGDKNAY